MNQQPWTILEISDEDLDAGNIANLVRLFDDIAVHPKNAKRLRCTISLSFGRFDKSDKPLWQVAKVRAFIRGLDQRFPFFPYFLLPQAEVGVMFTWFACLAAPAGTGLQERSGLMVLPHEMTLLLASRAKSVRDFCDRIFDNPDEVLAGMVGPFPEPIRAAALSMA